MKKYMLYLLALVLSIFSALWLRQGSGESATLQAAIATQRAALAPPTPNNRVPLDAQNEATALMERNAALSAELRRIEEATGRAHKENVALQKQIPPSLDTEITESFGRITDMGAELGQYSRLVLADSDELQQELKRRGLNPDELSDTIFKAFMKFVTWAPEISAMEDIPAEIAALQSTALRDTFTLSDAQAKQAESIIQTHFATMKAAGLTHSSHDAPEWQERRSASLTQLLWKLRPIIPANSKLTSHLTQIVNIGAGIETKTLAPAPGTTASQVLQNFADWPAVPWLPAKPAK